MTYEEALAFLESRIRWGMRPGTERVAALVEALDHPQRTYPNVHISGTNGKFSVSAIVTSILTHIGMTVGTYTSPHLESVRERIAIGGQPIDEDGFASVLAYLAPYIELIEGRRDDHVTYFELLTVMAFEAFFDRPVHAGVLETGLGGEYDATNVADAKVAIVTNVSLDHVRQFGPDLTKAAWEKGGIAKAGATVITGVEQPELLAVLTDRATERGATGPLRLGRDVEVLARRPAVGGQLLTIRGLHRTYDDVFLSLLGPHQSRNAALAVAACEAFVEERLDTDLLREALSDVRTPGRLEVCSRHPLVVCDGAHNPAATAAVRDAVRESFDYEELVLVVGMLDDKLIENVLRLWVDACDRFVLTAPATERAAEPGRLLAALNEAGVPPDAIDLVPSVPDAVASAVSRTGEDDLVLVTGSFVTVGEARGWLRSQGLLTHP